MAVFSLLDVVLSGTIFLNIYTPFQICIFKNGSGYDAAAEVSQDAASPTIFAVIIAP